MPHRLRGEAGRNVDVRPNVAAFTIEHLAPMHTAADGRELRLRGRAHFDIERAANRGLRFGENRHEGVADSFDDSAFPPTGSPPHHSTQPPDYLAPRP